MTRPDKIRPPRALPVKTRLKILAEIPARARKHTYIECEFLKLAGWPCYLRFHRVSDLCKTCQGEVGRRAELKKAERRKKRKKQEV